MGTYSKRCIIENLIFNFWSEFQSCGINLTSDVRNLIIQELNS